MAKQSAAEKVTEKILEALDAGVAPWIKPWNARPSYNMISGKAYRGINILLTGLSGHGPGFMTFNQSKNLGGNVKGEKGTMGVKYGTYDKKDKQGVETGETGAYLKVYYVYGIDQIKGLPDSYYEADTVEDRVDAPNILADALIAASGAKIQHGGTQPGYVPSQDVIQMPRREMFKTDQEYYGAIFHELIHWTGAKSRLDRLTKCGYGTGPYAAEELIAEIGSSALLNLCGMDGIQQTTAYCEGWAKALKGKASNLIVSAAGKAGKAVDMLTPELVPA